MNPKALFATLALVLIGGLGLAACGGSSAGSGAPPNNYLATGAGWADYIQWDNSGTGTLTSETLTGTAPQETVQSNRTPITVTVNGSQVDFVGLNPQYGTLSNNVLSLQVQNPDGTLGTDTFNPAGQDAFNKAVSALQTQASSANSLALQQQAQASTQAGNTAAENTASSDMTALANADNFSADLSKLAGDVSQTNTDLAGEKSDAANGVDGPGGTPCYNLESVVDYDAQSNVEYDATSNLGYDLQNGIGSDIATARQDIATLGHDLASLKAAGLPAPAGASATIATARQAISNAIATANGDIAQVNSDVDTAYAIGNGMATSSCTGPGSPPAPISPLS